MVALELRLYACDTVVYIQSLFSIQLFLIAAKSAEIDIYYVSAHCRCWRQCVFGLSGRPSVRAYVHLSLLPFVRPFPLSLLSHN